MRALLYDIHGNLPALEAVIADARKQGVERFVLGGDYLLFGAWPEETLGAIDDLDAVFLRGNAERWTASPEHAPDDPFVQQAIEWAAKRIGSGVVGEMAGFPTELYIEGACLVHGSRVSDVRTFMPEPADDEAELLEGVSAALHVFGHSHLQFLRESDSGPTLVNPGSVGMPFDGDRRAAYGLLRDGEVELRRVEYDAEASAAAVRERLGGWAETAARRIERASFES